MANGFVGSLTVAVRSRSVLAMQKVEGSSPFIRLLKPP
jgi:hypothetical protein